MPSESPTVNAVFTRPEKRMALDDLSRRVARQVRSYHRTVPGYAPTPLRSLPGLASALGIRALYIKDESLRFGLNAFKALGATWALARVIARELGLDHREMQFQDFLNPDIRSRIQKMNFATCTDGNHGRGVAWAAKNLGCRARIYMPAGTVESRIKNIEREGARVVVTEMNYDDTVRLAAAEARKNNWHLVQDTAWEGYETIPLWILQGYTTMADEALDQIEKSAMPLPTHLFLQAGVGSMAAAVLGYFAHALKENCPATYIIEPDRADCFYRSALAGEMQAVTGDLDTMMAGLACGEPNPYAWQILKDLATGFISCSDRTAALGMTTLARPLADDPPIVSGESGAVGPGLAKALMTDPAFVRIKEDMGFSRDSVLLCFSTEGDTDPVNYKKITGGTA